MPIPLDSENGSRSTRLQHAIPALTVILVIVGCYGGSAWLHPTRRALGSAWSEAPGHLWGLWTTASGLWQNGPFLRVAPGLGFPDGFAEHLVDPINLLLFLPGYWLGGGGVTGATLGWNLLHAGALVVAGLGCLVLARAQLGEQPGAPWAAALLTVAFTAGAFLLSHPHMGRSEYLPVVLMPWQLHYLLRWVGGQGGWRSGLAAGLLLGGVGLGGSYIAIFAALLVLPLSVGLLATSGRGWALTLGRLALVAGVTIAAMTPMAAALLLHPPSGMGSLTDRPFGIIPEAGPDTLLTMIRLGPIPDLAPLLDQPPYPGVVLLALALLGAIARPRKALGWLLLGLWLGVLSLGSALAIQGEGRPELIPMPAGWLQTHVPLLVNLKTWSRLGCLLPLPLGLAAMYGVTALLARLRAERLRALLGGLLVVAVLADQASWPRRTTLDRPSFEPTIPADLTTILGDLPPGAIVQLPLEVSVGKGIKLQAARSHLWQAQHGRAITATPGVISDTSLRWSYLARLAVNRQFAVARQQAGSREGPRALPGARGEPSETLRACGLADAADMRELGVSALVLDLDGAAGEEVMQLFEPILGAPAARVGALRAWDLRRVDAEDDAFGCSLPPVPGKVHVMLHADDGDPPSGGVHPGVGDPGGKGPRGPVTGPPGPSPGGRAPRSPGSSPPGR